MSIRIPALRNQQGETVYYTANITFKQILEFVDPITDELHKSKGLKDAIQRSLTDNYKAIKNYILTQDDRFFNSLVLAVYQGNPEWIEVRFEIGDDEFFDVGLLTLNGEEKIFPVDGQHRVEGIKAALKEKPDLATESIPVVFIGHNTSDAGMQKTRRIFSTLNRYAKPVSLGDIIALDEDDIVAITTRDLVENFPLFEDDKVIWSKQKAIPARNNVAFTSLVTLYECNRSMFAYYYNNVLKNRAGFKYYLKDKFDKQVSYKEFQKFRPDDGIIEEFQSFCNNFWTLFLGIDHISDYLEDSSDTPAVIYRNNNSGGSLLFRPAGLVPFVEAVMRIMEHKNLSIEDAIATAKSIELNINQTPWKNVLWDSITNKMKTSISKELVRGLALFLINSNSDDIFTAAELKKIKEAYASAIGFADNLNNISLSDLIAS